MKRIFSAAAIFLFLAAVLPFPALAQQVLVPVGEIVGINIKDDTVTVVAFDEALGSAARDAGLEIGDQLLGIDGNMISNAGDIQEILMENPQQIRLAVSRGGKQKVIHMEPQMSSTGPKLGVYLRQGVSGIGTITWYDPDSGRCGILGHGVSSPQGMLVQLTEGSAYPAEVSSVIPGKPGKPGLLKGIADGDRELGTLYRNTPQGIFGKMQKGFPGQVLPVAAFEEIHPGQASIRSTVTGTEPQEYSVEILKIYPESRQDCRNFLIKVTDSRLLSVTGGIVQGMSGSPILQDGRIIGAVTHVMVADPTTGYGIFIGNMLDAAA